MTCHDQHLQMEQGVCVRANRATSVPPHHRSKTTVFRLVVLSVCLAAAVVVIHRQRRGDGVVELRESDYAADTEDNIFSSHYKSLAERKWLALHPPVRKYVFAKTTVQRKKKKKGRWEEEATSFLSDIPGMGDNEMQELLKAASIGHAPLVEPVVMKQHKLSAKKIAEERIRSEDVFSHHYGRAVHTGEHALPVLNPASELRDTIGAAAQVMSDTGRAFAMAEIGGTAAPKQTNMRSVRHAAANMLAGYMPAKRTSTLALGGRRKHALASVPAIDRDLMSNLNDDQNEIEGMHIMTGAQREILKPSSARDIDSEFLKNSINSLADLVPASDQTDRTYGQHSERKQMHKHHLVVHHNGDKGAADRRQQMETLRRLAENKKTSSTTASFTKALNTGADTNFNREMRAAVIASNAGNAHYSRAIPIGDANMGDDSGAAEIVQDEKNEIHTERKNDKLLVQDASPMWPSAEITRNEKDREAQQRRKLDDNERKIAEHEKQLEADSEAAARAKARAQHEEKIARKARQEANVVHHMEKQATQKAHAPDKHVEQQTQEAAEHKLAVDHQKPQQPSGREHEEQEWARAQQAAEQKKQMERKAQERAKAAQQQSADEARRQWAQAEAENKRRAEERLAARHQARKREYAKDQQARQAREATERREKIQQEAQQRNAQQQQMHSRVHTETGAKGKEQVAEPNSLNDQQQAAEIEAEVKHLKMQLMTGTQQKDAERKALEKKEAEEQTRSTGSLHDIQILGKHVTENINILPDASSLAPTTSPVTLPAHPTQSTAAGQDPSWGNLISFMENGGAASSAPARSLVTKVKYKAAEHAQQLALSRADKDAEKEAMKMAEKRAMGVHHLTAREAAANVLGSMSHDTLSDASMSDDSDQSLGATVAHNPTAAADSAIGGKDDDSSALDDAHSDGNHSHKSLLTDKNFDQFLAHYKQTQAKEKQFSRLMKEHMADEKNDEKQVAQLRKEKEASENDDSSSLLKVAEVLGSVGASGFLSSAMGSSGIPKDLSAGSGAALAKRAMAQTLKVDPAAASEDRKSYESVGTVWKNRRI